ncbi:MAG: hypothetical protein ACREBN_12470, partial [Burkholderiaceae bacterium]
MDKQKVDVVGTDRLAAPVESGKARRWLLASTALVALALVAGTAVQNPAHAFPGSHGGPMGFGRGMHGPMDPATMGKKIDAMVGWVLADIDATPAQREKITAILKGATNDLAPLREQHRAARKQSLALLAAPTIDRAQL